jgi:predicted 2-oxoglutarate/Fe(II)-dependent dioxygenase YbiX
MDHTEAIVEIKNVIRPDFIKRIIPLINKKATQALEISTGVDIKTRNVKGYHLNFTTPTNLFYWNYIKKEIERVYVFYKAKFPKMESVKINQIDLLKYTSGGKYNLHTDEFGAGKRTLSVIMNLNNDYEGGDLMFADQKDKEVKNIKLDTGSFVFFPSNFMYPHCIQPITKGTRYSIVAWLQ